MAVMSFLLSFMVARPVSATHVILHHAADAAMCRMTALLRCARLARMRPRPAARRKRNWRGRDGAPGIVVSIESSSFPAKAGASVPSDSRRRLSQPYGAPHAQEIIGLFPAVAARRDGWLARWSAAGIGAGQDAHGLRRRLDEERARRRRRGLYQENRHQGGGELCGELHP